MLTPRFSSLGSTLPSRNMSGWSLWWMRCWSLVALCLACYLSWITLTGDSATGACSFTGSDCDAVLTSEWSKWFDLPISLGGVAVYGGILLATLMVSYTNSRGGQLISWVLIGGLSLLAALSGLWFVILQFQIGAFCLFCLSTHICGLMIAPVAWYAIPQAKGGRVPVPQLIGTGSSVRTNRTQSQDLQPAHLAMVVSITVLGMVILITGQIMSVHHTEEQLVFEDTVPPSASSEANSTNNSDAENASETNGLNTEPPEPENDKRIEVLKPVIPPNRTIRFFPGTAAMDIDRFPLCGNQDAQHVILKVMSYTCPACRTAHQHLEEALEELGRENYAVLIRPIALNPKCNVHVLKEHEHHKHSCPLTRLALAVWIIDPTQFKTMHDYLLAEEKRIPTLEEAQRFAVDLVGAEALKKAIRDPAVFQMMEVNHELMKWQAKKLPTMVIGKKKIQGKTKTGAVLVDMIRGEVEGTSSPSNSDLALPTG